MIKFTEKDILMPLVVAGVKFRNPFFVSSGPTTKSPEHLTKAEEAGWAAASIKLTFDPEPYLNPEPRYGYFSDLGYLAFTAEKRLNVEEGLELVREGLKCTRQLIIFANITYVGEKGLQGWVDMARRFEDAGAHIIELNMCCPNMSFNVEITGEVIAEGPRTGASLGQDARAVATIVQAVKKAVSIPVFVKTTAEGGGVAQVARACFEAGADAVGTNSNRLGIPSIDINSPDLALYHLQDEPSMSCMCGPWLKPLALRDVYEMRKLVGPERVLTATGGIFTYEDAVQFSMAGADLFGMCTATLVKGFEFLPELIKNLKAYLGENGYKSLQDVRDKLVEGITPATDLSIHPGYMRIKEPYLSAPCKFACPNSVPAQAYVRKVAERDFETAFKLITSSNPMQSVCGYICDHPCETECTRALMDEPIMIREIKRFVLEYAQKQGWQAQVERGPAREEKVAVIGSGPVGISCAWNLARVGYKVTMFEAASRPGGMLRYGVPRFRLPLNVLKREIDALTSLGVEIKTKKALGSDFTLEDLRAGGYEPVFLGLGAPKGWALGIPGESAEGCIEATRFLREFSLNNEVQIGERVAVVGGGFTAVDAARTAIRLGAREVFILYRRTRDEMPAVPEEVWEAEGEGVRIMYLVSPKEILTRDGKVVALRMVNHTLGEYDTSQRRKPEEVKGTEFTLEVDTVISAIGQEVSFLPSGLKITPQGTIECDLKTGATNIPWIFVGGDAATGPSSVIEAVASGKRAAVSIDKFIAQNAAFLEYPVELKVVDKEKVLLRVEDLQRKHRPELEKINPEKRKTNFETYTRTLTEEEAVAEASRCLGCGCGIGCGLCARVCQSFAVNPRNLDSFLIDEEKCVACGICYNLCPNDNIEVVKKE